MLKPPSPLGPQGSWPWGARGLPLRRPLWAAGSCSDSAGKGKRGSSGAADLSDPTVRYRGTQRPLLAARPSSSAPRVAKPSGVLQGYEWSPPGVGVRPASLEGSAQAAAPGRYRHVDHRRILALPGSVAITCHLHRSTPFSAGSAARGCWTGEGTRCCHLLLCPELVCALIGVTPAPALPRRQDTEPFVSARSRACLSVCWDHAVRCSRGRLCASLCLCVQFAAAQLGAGSVLSVFSPSAKFSGHATSPGCS